MYRIDFTIDKIHKFHSTMAESCLKCETNIINWVVRALNADWLTAVVYQTVNHGYDKQFIFTALIKLVTSL